MWIGVSKVNTKVRSRFLVVANRFISIAQVHKELTQSLDVTIRSVENLLVETIIPSVVITLLDLRFVSLQLKLIDLDFDVVLGVTWESHTLADLSNDIILLVSHELLGTRKDLFVHNIQYLGLCLRVVIGLANKLHQNSSFPARSFLGLFVELVCYITRKAQMSSIDVDPLV